MLDLSFDARSFVESQAHTLFRRCKQCPDLTPSCSPCPVGQQCSLIVSTCDVCAHSTCVADPNAAATNSAPSPAGPIAGGVIGGIAAVGLAVFLWYWYYMRPKKKNWASQHLEDLKGIQTPENQSFMEARSHRASTHSVKTTGSRASIPIAYIPGVTSRGDAGSPDIIPPVPPIPAAGGAMGGTLSPRQNTGNEMFFRPESTYTEADRRSTRSSIADSEYHNDAILNPMPASTAISVKATPISLMSKPSHSGFNSPSRTPNASPPPSHQNSIAQRMHGPMTGTSGQARQITITRSSSNMRGPGHMNVIAELDDTSTGAPTPRMFASELDDTSIGSRTPRLAFDRSGTASPRSMMSDDAEHLEKTGRWRRPSGAAAAAAAGGGASLGLTSPDPNNPPVSATGQSTFSRSSPVSAMEWDPTANIRNTIQADLMKAYGAYGSKASSINGNQNESPFADKHATGGH